MSKYDCPHCKHEREDLDNASLAGGFLTMIAVWIGFAVFVMFAMAIGSSVYENAVCESVARVAGGEAVPSDLDFTEFDWFGDPGECSIAMPNGNRIAMEDIRFDGGVREAVR